ncbi:3-hydroxyisobutyryl-CoA hydrolase [Pseudonocardia sp. Ae168_Ps1]|uniref:enoyl-CoA hydratase/isomerase family protein n=1 Tax=unclassified Pseudonocardia TaxID=2619320 RepID=UPI00094B72A1|nr:MULTISPECIES: enoyl-CoA hydratase/isomerase family protein [unclassified Pseudonocardia]OLL74460.1 3-hydroxyisobutyryl-CoA hydrolase [Pseudonocardia sp. Ae150A_Ps1]OLL80440.1 3-hydroxyisobutyryl-CoA hydrolase [Pseudonocardia sp. Ae168_Ps1]OLL85433.1 3-hydroxyisobutyryl-CoA hydrolase [Pseudonocardia sp. Ae263_Ps1]OLL94540.1 3-hydroxyisobutyryl-CoA hydrolase [Pseudonocardia sp. Ae356_Ps1]
MSEVDIDRAGGIGRIVLNRPEAINALTHDMVREIHTALQEWIDDDTVGAVVLTGAGERGLCAGGDIRAIHDDAKTGGEATRAFWRDEYHLNALIGSYPKPFVAVMDGLVMGGGVGLSGHASHRIVTERTRIAMPEVGIGLVPDVGGTWLLARASGQLGLHAALTGTTLGAGDALAMGLADWYVPTDKVPALLAALGDVRATGPDLTELLGHLLQELAEPEPEPALGPSRWWIDRCYASGTAEEIVADLAASGVPDAEDTAKTIGQKSPTCVKVALAGIRRARDLTSLEQALDQEFRVSLRCLEVPDLVEGIRAQVVDKDRTPRWAPAVLEHVDHDLVQAYFAPLTDTAELGLGDDR